MKKFQYTAEELKVLSNFATINQNMIILPDKFAVINGAKKSVVGYYKFDKKYDYEPYGIFNLPEFLTLMKVYKDEYELAVHDKYVEVFYPSSNSGTKYNLTPHELLPQVGEISEKFSKLEINLDFDLPAENIVTLKHVANILGLERIYFQSVASQEIILLTAAKKHLEKAENPHVVTINDKKTNLRVNSLGDTVLYINVDELQILEGDYRVRISSRGISHWENQFLNVEYYIGVNTLETE